jgi:hypothetical protein
MLLIMPSMKSTTLLEEFYIQMHRSLASTMVTVEKLAKMHTKNGLSPFVLSSGVSCSSSGNRIDSSMVKEFINGVDMAA